MKINEIWGGGSLRGIAGELAKHYGGQANYDVTQKYRQQRSADAKIKKDQNTQTVPPQGSKQPVPTPATQPTQQAEPASRLGMSWIDTTMGIGIKPATQTSPTMAFYQKKYYILNNLGQWLTTNKRPVPETMSALLNQALEQT